ncbi:MAG: tRNA (N(6)-L-threonylcarbamoyladenosine(37)-C(2))-methylthiotransferase MtaB, partial [Cytophagales bacterium]
KVLFENDVEGGKIHGFTENYVRVCTQYDPLLINEIKKVRLSSIEANGTVAVEEAESEVLSHH